MTTLARLAQVLGLSESTLNAALTRFALECAMAGLPETSRPGDRHARHGEKGGGPGVEGLPSTDQPAGKALGVDPQPEPRRPSPMLPEGVTWIAISSKDFGGLWKAKNKNVDPFGDLCVLAISRLLGRGCRPTRLDIAHEIVGLLGLPPDPPEDQRIKFFGKISSKLGSMKDKRVTMVKEPTGNGKEMDAIWGLVP